MPERRHLLVEKKMSIEIGIMTLEAFNNLICLLSGLKWQSFAQYFRRFLCLAVVMRLAVFCDFTL